MGNKPAINPRIISLRIVLTKDEHAILKREAYLKGQSANEYVRRAVFGVDYKERFNKTNEK